MTVERSLPKTTWRRPQFDAWLAQQDAADIKRARQFRLGVMQLAQASPMARAALGWARQNDIVFAVDLEGSGGYYVQDTGVVVLSYKKQVSPMSVETLVHELRHAWQDHKGLLPVVSGSVAMVTNPVVSLQQTAYVEADAYAHGRLAARQAEGHTDEPRQALRHYFHAWFDAYAKVYQQHYIAYRMRCLKPTSNQPQRRGFIFSQTLNALQQPGIAPESAADIEKLGRSFTGLRYLNGLDRDVRLRQIGAAHAALTAFSNVSEPQSADILTVRKSVIRHDLAQPKKRYPLPG